MFHGPTFPINNREILQILYKMGGFMERFSTSPSDFKNHFVRTQLVITVSCMHDTGYFCSDFSLFLFIFCSIQYGINATVTAGTRLTELPNSTSFGRPNMMIRER